MPFECAYTGRRTRIGRQCTYRGKAKYLGGVGIKIAAQRPQVQTQPAESAASGDRWRSQAGLGVGQSFARRTGAEAAEPQPDLQASGEGREFSAGAAPAFPGGPFDRKSI